MHFYTADPHYNHGAIIRHCNRPFQTTEEMNQTLITNLQKQVGPKDDLWILGDFFFERSKLHPQSIFDQLPGQKHLIKGNHDGKKTLRLNWASIHDVKTVKDDGKKFYLFHYPLMTWPGSRYDTIHLFGHVHNNWEGSDRSINVGVDFWDFKAATAQEIVAKTKTLPKAPLWDTLEPGT